MNRLNLSRALSVCVAAMLLAGCGGSPSGIAPNSRLLLRTGAVPPRHHHKYQGLRDLYVTDAANNVLAQMFAT